MISFYGGDDVLYETNENNELTVQYTWDDAGNPVSMTKNGETYYYHLNGHADVTALTDSKGNVVASYAYDAWGNITAQSGPLAEGNPYRYAGYRYDEQTGLYYLLARYYNPMHGHFLTLDPDPGMNDMPLTKNGYQYGLNNPVNLIDPDGENPLFIVFVVIVKVAIKVLPKVIKAAKTPAKKVAKAPAKKITKGTSNIVRLGEDGIKYAVSNPSRMQHAFKHAKDLGFGNWNKQTAQQWNNYVGDVLRTATKSFDNKLGQDAVKGFYKVDANGYNVAAYVYKSGPNAGRVASVVRLSDNQMIKFGLK